MNKITYIGISGKNPDHVLEQAKGQYRDLIIIGRDANGELDVRANLDFSDQAAVYAINEFLHKLFNGDYSK